MSSLRIFTAIGVSLALITTPVSGMGAFSMDFASGPALNPAEIQIPSEIGTIEETYRGSAKELVVYIQDAHANYSAQKNIAAAIESLVSQHDINLITVEAAEGDVETELFRTFPIPEVTRRVMDRYLSKGELGGPQLAAVTGEAAFDLVGVDQKELYAQNLNEFLSVLDIRASGLEFVNKVEISIKHLKSVLQSKPHRELDRLLERYRSDRTNLLEFLKALRTQAEDRGLSVGSFRHIISLFDDVKTFEFRHPRESGDPEELSLLEKEFHHVDTESLFREIDGLATELKLKLALTEEERRLIRLEKYLTLLRHGLELELSRSDLGEFSSLWKEFPRDRILEFLGSQANTHHLRTVHLDGIRSIPIDQYVEQIFAFYKTATKREEGFFKFLEKQMQSRRQSTSILVAGGFHREGITKRLRKAGISYVTILPAIEEIGDHEDYLRLMRESGSLLGVTNKTVPKGIATSAVIARTAKARTKQSPTSTEIASPSISAGRQILRARNDTIGRVVDAPEDISRFFSGLYGGVTPAELSVYGFGSKGELEVEHSARAGFEIVGGRLITKNDMIEVLTRWNRRNGFGATAKDMAEDLVRGLASRAKLVAGVPDTAATVLMAGKEETLGRTNTGFGAADSKLPRVDSTEDSADSKRALRIGGNASAQTPVMEGTSQESSTPFGFGTNFSLAQIDTIVKYWYNIHYRGSRGDTITVEAAWRVFWLYRSIFRRLAVDKSIQIDDLVMRLDIALMDDKKAELNESEEDFLYNIGKYFSDNRTWTNRYESLFQNTIFSYIEERLRAGNKISILMPGDMMGLQSLIVLDIIGQVLKKIGRTWEEVEIKIVSEDIPENISRLNDFVYLQKDIHGIQNSSILFDELGVNSRVVENIYQLAPFAKKHITFRAVDLRTVDAQRNVSDPFDLIFVGRTLEYLKEKNGIFFDRAALVNAYSYLNHSLKDGGMLIYYEGLPITGPSLDVLRYVGDEVDGMVNASVFRKDSRKRLLHNERLQAAKKVLRTLDESFPGLNISEAITGVEASDEEWELSIENRILKIGAGYLRPNTGGGKLFGLTRQILQRIMINTPAISLLLHEKWDEQISKWVTEGHAKEEQRNLIFDLIVYMWLYRDYNLHRLTADVLDNIKGRKDDIWGTKDEKFVISFLEKIHNGQVEVSLDDLLLGLDSRIKRDFRIDQFREIDRSKIDVPLQDLDRDIFDSQANMTKSGESDAGFGENSQDKEGAPRLGLNIDSGGNDAQWDEVVRNHWSSGVDYSRLFGDKHLLVIGDTNHGHVGVQRGFIDHLEELKAAGVTHLAVEIPSDDDPNNISDIAQRTWIPHRFRQLLERTRTLGIEIVFIDMPTSEQDQFPSYAERSHRRGIKMGENLAALARRAAAENPKARIAAIVGYGHFEAGEVPDVLKRESISHALAVAVVEGQSEIFRDEELVAFVLPVSRAVLNHAERGRTYGYIDLSSYGGVNIDGVVHYAQPSLEAPRAQELRSLSAQERGAQTTALSLTDQVRSITRVNEGQLTTPLAISYADRVSTNSLGWSRTNHEKIADFVARLEGISMGQKIYLYVMLAAYAENTGKHSLSGSIVDVGFIPEGQFFEISTVDTFHYAYEPGKFNEKRWEVSLRTLQERFGFDDLMPKDLRDMPEVRVGPNSDRPGAMAKVFLLALAHFAHPERIALVSGAYESIPRMKIFYGDVSKRAGQVVETHLTELTFDDFQLNDIEEEFERARTLSDRLHKVIADLMHSHFGIRGQDRKFEIREAFQKQLNWITRRKPVRAYETAVDALDNAYWQYRDYVFASLFPNKVMEARKNLDFLSEEQQAELLQALNRSLTAFQKAWPALSEFYSYLPQFGDIKGPRAPGYEVFRENIAHYDGYDIMNLTGRGALDIAKDLSRKLEAARDRIQNKIGLVSLLSIGEKPQLPAGFGRESVKLRAGWRRDNLVKKGNEFFDRKIGVSEQRPQRAGLQEAVVGDGKDGAHPLFFKDNVGAPFTHNPTGFLERFDRLWSGDIGGQFRHEILMGRELSRNRDYTTFFMALLFQLRAFIQNFQTITNRLSDVVADFLKSFPLTHTAWNSWTLGHVTAGFIGIYNDIQSHGRKFTSPPVGSQAKRRGGPRAAGFGAKGKNGVAFSKEFTHKKFESINLIRAMRQHSGLKARLSKILRGIYPSNVINQLKSRNYDPVVLGIEHGDAPGILPNIDAVEYLLWRIKQVERDRPIRVGLEVTADQIRWTQEFLAIEKEFRDKGTVRGEPAAPGEERRLQEYRRKLMGNYFERLLLELWSYGFDVIPIKTDGLDIPQVGAAPTFEGSRLSAGFKGIARDQDVLEISKREQPDILVMGDYHALKFDLLLNRNGNRSHYFLQEDFDWDRVESYWSDAHQAYRDQFGKGFGANAGSEVEITIADIESSRSGFGANRKPREIDPLLGVEFRQGRFVLNETVSAIRMIVIDHWVELRAAMANAKESTRSADQFYAEVAQAWGNFINAKLQNKEAYLSPHHQFRRHSKSVLSILSSLISSVFNENEMVSREEFDRSLNYIFKPGHIVLPKSAIQSGSAYDDLTHEEHHRVWHESKKQNAEVIDELEAVYKEMILFGRQVEMPREGTLSDFFIKHAAEFGYDPLDAEEFWVRFADDLPAENENNLGDFVRLFYKTILREVRNKKPDLYQRFREANRLVRSQRSKAVDEAKKDLDALSKLDLLNIGESDAAGFGAGAEPGNFGMPADDAARSERIQQILQRGMPISDYSTLPEEDKPLLRVLFSETFKPRQSEVDKILGRPPTSYVLTSDEKMNFLVRAAQELLASHPQDKIVSLGRTPLWFVETARLLEGETQRFEYMAFSGRWYEEKSGRLVPGPTRPNQEQTEAYRKYLTSIGLNPEAIVESFERDGARTVIVEYTQKGESLMSILSWLSDWARALGLENKVQKAIVVRILQDPILEKVPYLGGYVIERQEVDHELVRDLANSDYFNDSMGIHFPYWKWTESVPNRLGESISRNAALVRFRIIDYLASRGFLRHTPRAQASKSEDSETVLRPAGFGAGSQLVGSETVLPSLGEKMLAPAQAHDLAGRLVNLARQRAEREMKQAGTEIAGFASAANVKTLILTDSDAKAFRFLANEVGGNEAMRSGFGSVEQVILAHPSLPVDEVSEIARERWPHAEVIHGQANVTQALKNLTLDRVPLEIRFGVLDKVVEDMLNLMPPIVRDSMSQIQTALNKFLTWASISIKAAAVSA